MIRRMLTSLGFGLVILGCPAAQAAEVGEMPPPIYAVEKQRSVMIPMRDGTRQSANIYLPKGAGARVPVILMRTPYGKDVSLKWVKDGKTYESLLQGFASRGFAFVVTDTRGRFESEGEYLPQLGDADDGFDTIQWLSKQPWSNGKVGMYGCSYSGDVQIFAAQTRPPALKALVPGAAGSSIGSAGGQYKYFGARQGGAIAFAQNIAWFYKLGAKHYLRPPANLSREEFLANIEFYKLAPTLPEVDYSKLWWQLPVNKIMTAPGIPANDFTDLATRPVTDKWWDQFHYMTDDYKSDVPALHVNSWYDFGARETIFEFEAMRRNSVSKLARDNQYLLLSPTTHCQSEFAKADGLVGERDLGDARYDYWKVYLDWFAYWLKGEQNAASKLPRVTYYLMGQNVWKTASEWPVPGTVPTKFYLHSGGRANGRLGDGLLSLKAPGPEPADTFAYDPASPVPTKGGPVCCTGKEAPAGSFDQREIEMRNDVLVYTSEPLDEGVEVTGPIDTVLFVSSDARDTDFTAKLVDVYPDGRAFNIVDGILRARYREGQTKEVMMERGGVYRLEIDVGATSNYFGRGHRIRIEISSSNFPRWDRNLNTGGRNYDEVTWVTANNTVHHSGTDASYVILPLVKPH